jgi:hypothetical protein
LHKLASPNIYSIARFCGQCQSIDMLVISSVVEPKQFVSAQAHFNEVFALEPAQTTAMNINLFFVVFLKKQYTIEKI